MRGHVGPQRLDQSRLAHAGLAEQRDQVAAALVQRALEGLAEDRALVVAPDQRRLQPAAEPGRARPAASTPPRRRTTPSPSCASPRRATHPRPAGLHTPGSRPGPSNGRGYARAQVEQPRHPVRNLLSRAHSFLFRASGGRFGRKLRGAPVLVLETLGRTTGKVRSVPLLYVEDAGDWIVMASSGGDPRHPLWFTNLEAEPRVTVVTEAGRRAAEAIVTEGEERDRLFAQLRAIYPSFDAYRERTTRELPVVRLRPQA
jgi:F420H(2)-dependent quinone reductase